MDLILLLIVLFLLQLYHLQSTRDSGTNIQFSGREEQTKTPPPRGLIGRPYPRRSTRSRNTPTRVSVFESYARQWTPAGSSSASVSQAFNFGVRSPSEFPETSEPDNTPDQLSLRRSNRERRPPSRFQAQGFVGTFITPVLCSQAIRDAHRD